MYKIKNRTDKARWCHDKLIESEQEFETDNEIYVKMANLSLEIFSVDESIVKPKIKKVKEEIIDKKSKEE